MSAVMISTSRFATVKADRLSRRPVSNKTACATRVIASAKFEPEINKACAPRKDSLLAVMLGASLLLSAPTQVAFADDSSLSPSERRQLAIERRKELLAKAREKAEQNAASVGEDSAPPPVAESAPEPAEAPKPRADLSLDLKAMLQDYQSSSSPSGGSSQSQAAEPQDSEPQAEAEPKNNPLFGFGTSKPAAATPTPAAEENPPAQMPSLKFSAPKPEPAPAKQEPKEAPKPVPAKDASATDIKKSGKRKGPLPLFLAQLLMGGVLVGVGAAGTKYSRETSEASKVAGAFLRKWLTTAEAAIKGAKQ
mmetsp:Transcript_15695/g.37284  ORF Transcript_15695/g.37284 Transcript_15695/m.37284 type:complete len:308 (-) Transcript_15695:161-1084(-)